MYLFYILAYVYVYMYICMYICIYVNMYLCVCGYVCMHMFIHTYIHIHIHTFSLNCEHFQELPEYLQKNINTAIKSWSHTIWNRKEMSPKVRRVLPCAEAQPRRGGRSFLSKYDGDIHEIVEGIKQRAANQVRICLFGSTNQHYSKNNFFLKKLEY